MNYEIRKTALQVFLYVRKKFFSLFCSASLKTVIFFHVLAMLHLDVDFCLAGNCSNEESMVVFSKLHFFLNIGSMSPKSTIRDVNLFAFLKL